jgi:predicted transcriptional regulator
MVDTDLPNLTELSAEIVAKYVAHNTVTVSDLPSLIATVRSSLNGLTGTSQSATEPFQPIAKAKPAAIRKSITNDALISFIDGKPYRMLKRHITTNGMTVAGYREKFGLPDDYPIVAPSYSAVRSAMAKRLGLGSKGRGAARSSTPAPVAAPKVVAKSKAAELSQKDKVPVVAPKAEPVSEPKKRGRPKKIVAEAVAKHRPVNAIDPAGDEFT